MMVRHQSDPIPSVQALNPAISVALDDLLQWGMAKKPGDRPGNAAAFAHWLHQTQQQPNQPLPRPNLAATEVGLGRTEVVSPPVREGMTGRVGEGETRRGGDAATGERREERSGSSAWLLWVGVLVVVILVAVFVLGRGLFAAATPTLPPPTATTLAPTPTIILTPTPTGQLLFDDFSDPFAGFGIKADEDGGVAYEAETLLFTSQRNGVFWFSLSERLNEADVSLQVDVTLVEGQGSVEMGVICRWQDVDNFVALTVNPTGGAMIWQRVNGEIITLAEGDAAAILPGQTIQLQATCQGQTLSLTADGVDLLTATTESLTPGDAALLTRQRAEGEWSITFDNLYVRQP